MTPTAPPDEGVISWNMNTTCNYRCSYCTQRFKDDRGRWARDVPRFIDAFVALPGAWEVKLSGGEPFIHPQFLDVVRALAARGFRVGVVTNFSAPRNELDAFLDAAGERLSVLSASLHLEYVREEDPSGRHGTVAHFIERLRHVAGRIGPSSSVCATCVATAANLPRLPALRARFEDAGIPFKVQPDKQDGRVVAYGQEQVRELVRLGGHNRTGMVAPSFQGRPCWAGARYFIVDDQGNAYRCYPARRRRTEALGNLLDGTFHPHAGPRPCLYDYCNCTVPIARGMMPTEGAPDAFIAAD
ncbi:MAG: radical SAM protein [Deltaproteobacteria bacterium]|nr:radical SAM protein [Deltaproteobacteria bacterium]